MSEPGGWTTPEGWGPPAASSPTAPSYGPPSPGQYGGPRPEVKPGVVPLRPLGLGELLDGAVGVLRRYPRPTLGLSAAVAVVATAVSVVLLLTAFRPFADVGGGTLDAGDPAALEAAVGGAAVGGLLTGVLELLSTAVLTGVLTAVVGKAVLGQAMTLSGAWVAVRPHLLKLVGLALLLALIGGGTAFVGVLVGVLVIVALGGVGALVGVPLILAGLGIGVWLYIRLSLAPCALVLEQLSIGGSLRRSWVLVRGDWWRVFGITLLTFVVALFVGLVIQVPFQLLGYGSLGALAGGGDALATRALLLSSIGSIVVATLVDPFTAGVRALLYVDRRMRAEGLDVALTAAAGDRSSGRS
jgi:hypothetical protein